MKGLIYFACSNIFSFKEDVEFTMESSKEELVTAIYGGNASGKTNFLKAIETLKYLILTSNSLKAGDEILLFPFKKTLDKPSEFKIVFKQNSIKYAYYIKLNKEKVLEENLYHYPNGKISKIFTRIFNEENQQYHFEYPRGLTKELKELESLCSSNKIFLALASSFKEIEEIKNPITFFSKTLISNIGIAESDWLERSAELLSQDSHEKEVFLKLIKEVLPGLENIVAKVERKKIKIEELPSNLPIELKVLLSGNEEVKIDIKLKYSSGIILDLSEESRGVIRAIEILGPVLNILKNGQVLLFDEIESSFHPSVAKKIIQLFLDEKQNSKKAQLIFTTHDVNLLENNFLKKEQIWFTERNENNDFSTVLFPLSSINGIKVGENFRRNYLLGKYSWIPRLEGFHIEEMIKDESDEK